jgi:hypothetical protein
MTAPPADLRHGLCVSSDPDTGKHLYDPDWWTVATPSNWDGRANNDRAKEICRQCPVKTLCAQYAIDHPADVAGHIYAGVARRRAAQWRDCARPGCGNRFLTAHAQRLYCSRRCAPYRRKKTPNGAPQ